MCSVDDRLGSRRARPPDVLHEGIWSGLDQADVLVAGPADQIGRAAILPSDLEDLGVALVLPYAVTHDHELVPNLGLHRFPFPNSRDRRRVGSTGRPGRAPVPRGEPCR